VDGFVDGRVDGTLGTLADGALDGREMAGFDLAAAPAGTTLSITTNSHSIIVSLLVGESAADRF